MAPYRRPPSRPSTQHSAAAQYVSPSSARAVSEEPLGFGKSSAVVGKATVHAADHRVAMTTSSSSSPIMTSSTLRDLPQNLTASVTSTIEAATSAIGSATGTIGSATSSLGSKGSSNSSTSSSTVDHPPRSTSASPAGHEETPTFIKAFVFSPEVPIRVDYRGKNVRGDTNMISNPVTNLLIGLAQLNCSELRLKSLCYRQGLLGYGRLAEWVTLQWINDIKTSQLPSILGGVGPMHSFIQLFSGLVDLVRLSVDYVTS